MIKNAGITNVRLARTELIEELGDMELNTGCHSTNPDDFESFEDFFYESVEKDSFIEVIETHLEIYDVEGLGTYTNNDVQEIWHDVKDYINDNMLWKAREIVQDKINECEELGEIDQQFGCQFCKIENGDLIDLDCNLPYDLKAMDLSELHELYCDLC